MRCAGKRSFDGESERRGVQTPSTDASTAGFGQPDAAEDRSALRADILGAHRSGPGQPSGNIRADIAAARREDCNRCKADADFLGNGDRRAPGSCMWLLPK
jgi:hypothetical protein